MSLKDEVLHMVQSCWNKKVIFPYSKLYRNHRFTLHIHINEVFIQHCTRKCWQTGTTGKGNVYCHESVCLVYRRLAICLLEQDWCDTETHIAVSTPPQSRLCVCPPQQVSKEAGQTICTSGPENLCFTHHSLTKVWWPTK